MGCLTGHRGRGRPGPSERKPDKTPIGLGARRDDHRVLHPTRRHGIRRTFSAAAGAVKDLDPRADGFCMYRCQHCEELHFAADQARHCAACGDDWVPGAIDAAKRKARRGPLPWAKKMALRSRERWTSSERRLWAGLKSVLPEAVIRPQWCLPGCDYRVDFFLPDLELVVEVDGGSHRGREGPDRLRSLDIRALGYDVARATAAHVRADTNFIVAQLAFRVETCLTPSPRADEEPEDADCQGADLAVPPSWATAAYDSGLW